MASGFLHRGYRYTIFTGVKYLTYALLLANVFFFLREESAALQHTFAGAISFAQFVQVFASTIDTTAWVALLLLFELETSILDDDVIRGGVKRSIHGVRLIAGAAILWAFTGYYSELTTLYQSALLDNWAACEHVAERWSLLVRLDEYTTMDASNCGSLATGALQISDFHIVASAPVLQAARYLAWTDLINSATWILVVILLEVEVRLQLKGRLTDRRFRTARYLKFVLYTTLFVAAVYWGFEGKFLDFWDASLWLFAFIFIELNVFDWHQETQEDMNPIRSTADAGQS